MSLSHLSASYGPPFKHVSGDLRNSQDTVELRRSFAVIIKYLGKYWTISLILSCVKEAIYKRQNSIFIFYIYVSEK